MLILFFYLLAGLTNLQAEFTKPQDGFILITSLYNENKKERIKEYKLCLLQNLNHPLIKKIHVFYDSQKDSSNHKENKLLQHIKTIPADLLTITTLKDRPTFQDCFDLANRRYLDQKIIIANADIFFNDTLYALYEYDLEHKFLGLTRWDLKENSVLKFYNKINSQDAWIFKSPIRKFEKSTYKLGTLQCDNHIAYQAKKAGYLVQNPCLTIQACHLHLSDTRNYSQERLNDPLASIPFTKLKK